MREYMASHTKRVESFEEVMLKQRDRINGTMTEMFELLKELTSSLMPEKVLIIEETRHPIIKNVDTISLCRIKKKDHEVVDENIIKRSECNKINEDITSEPIRTMTRGPLDDEREFIKPPKPQPVNHYLKHKINEELIEGLIENQRFNDSLLAMRLGGHFVIPCNIGGFKYMDSLVDQGSDVNVMPLSTYNRLTNKKFFETNIRLSLASQSHIYPLGIVEDVSIEFEERKEDKINALNIVKKRILEWEERIMLHHDKGFEFDQWRNKMSNNKNSMYKDESSSSGRDENQRGVT
nr:hypothetical protein [Tanacetum cinerariifolium]